MGAPPFGEVTLSGPNQQMIIIVQGLRRLQARM